MDDHVTYLQQLQEDDGPVVLINPFTVAPEDAARFIEAWTDDAAFMKQQPGFISSSICAASAPSGSRYSGSRRLPRCGPIPACRPTLSPNSDSDTVLRSAVLTSCRSGWWRT
jgi:hypothetical protein